MFTAGFLWVCHLGDGGAVCGRTAHSLVAVAASQGSVVRCRGRHPENQRRESCSRFVSVMAVESFCGSRIRVALAVLSAELSWWSAGAVVCSRRQTVQELRRSIGERRAQS